MALDYCFQQEQKLHLYIYSYIINIFSFPRNCLSKTSNITSPAIIIHPQPKRTQKEDEEEKKNETSCEKKRGRYIAEQQATSLDPDKKQQYPAVSRCA